MSTTPHLHQREEHELRRVNVRLSPVFLANILGLPKGSKIISVSADRDPIQLAVAVEHPGLPPVPVDAMAPYVDVRMMRAIDDGRAYWSSEAAFDSIEGWTPPVDDDAPHDGRIEPSAEAPHVYVPTGSGTSGHDRSCVTCGGFSNEPGTQHVVIPADATGAGQ